MLTTLTRAPHQAGTLQQANVLRDRGERHRKWFGDVRDAGWPARQPGEDRPAGGIGDRGEHVIERRRDIQPTQLNITGRRRVNRSSESCFAFRPSGLMTVLPPDLPGILQFGRW